MDRTFSHRRALLSVACAISLLGLPVAAAHAGPSPAALPAAGVPVYLNTSFSFQERAADLVSRMTLAEKVAQLNTSSAPAIPRLGVQQYTYWSEGQHGINTLGADTNSGGVGGGVHATSFPTNFASSMSWDPSLIYNETTAISDEVRGTLDKSLWGAGQNNLGPSSSDYGSLTFWAPTVNMDRDPRWGRTDEAFGEDPYLVGQTAGAFVNGYEGNTTTGAPTTAYLKVAATAKHYALNDTENQRTGISSNATDADIRQYYTAQFASLIENAHVSGLMTSYNAINGTPAVADTYTVNQLARDTYGFGGYITSDCGAVGTTYQNPPSGHDWAPPGWTTDNQGSNATWTNTATGAKISGQAGGQAYALRAGTALNCAGFDNTVPNIQAAINVGILSEGVIDTALVKVFTVRMRTGEFDPAGSVPYTSITKAQIQSPAHQALATTVADNSLVLLQNNNVTGTTTKLLPANPATLNKVVILGDQANIVNLGNYSGAPTLQVSAVQGITNAVKAANPNATIVYDAAATSTTATTPAVLSAQTQSDIKTASLVVLFVGTDHGVADEGKDRTTIAMPGNYDSMINQATALGNPNTALVIQSGGPVTINDVQAKVPAVLFSGFNGESQGTALADVLFGKQNPSGHLNFTWYKDDTQLPAMSNYGLTPAATGGLGRTYQYFTGTPTYPFGYGLSYSNFSYSPATADVSSVSADGTVNVGFTVTNTGNTAGATVAQLYAATPFTVSGVQLPIKRLEGFHKTAVLAPGAAEHVTIPIKVSDLAFWDSTNMRSVVYDGTYQFQVGASSSSIASSAQVAVTGAITPKVQTVTVQPEAVVYNAGDTIDLTGKNQWLKDDTNPSLEQRNLSVTADNVVQAVNNDQSFVNLANASVTYSSSNPAVATVTGAGLVRAVADGAATISVTVNGVTGTTPIIVRHTLILNSPPVTGAGTSVTATTSYVNGSAAAVSNVQMAMTAPSGWTASASTPSSFSQVAAGQRVQTTWQLTAPSGAAIGSYPVSAQVTVAGATYTDAASVSIPYASMTAAFGNPGISDDGTPAAGNFDGGGASFSAQALSAAGLSPGVAFQHDGVTFTWPNVAAGTADNIVAGGQAFLVSGSGAKLGFLGASAFGTSSGSGTIAYTDGTTQSYSLAFADWWSKTAAGGSDVAAALPYLNTGGGKQTQPVNMYFASVPLQAGKTVRAVILPNVSSGATQGTTAMHVFALGFGNSASANPVVSFRAHANSQFVTADNAGASPLIANRASVGQWEQFDEVDLGNNNVALFSHADNRYVTADNAGAAPLIANRTSIGPWETFTLIHNPDGSVSLRSMANNLIVTADNAGAAPLIANRTAIGPWEEFDLIFD